MSPPDKPGIPDRFRRPGAVEDIVTATGPHTPMPPPLPPRARQQSRPEPPVELDAELLSEQATAKTFRPGVRPWAAIIAVVISSAASIITTYMVTHATPTDCASKGDMNAAQKQLSDLSATLTSLTATVNKNADNAQNETAKLQSTVTRNADRTEQSIIRLQDKLDMFMKR